MISSKSNAQIKYLASLKNKKYRDLHSKYLIEGVKLVYELLNSGDDSLEFVLYSREILESVAGGDKLLTALSNSSAVVEETTRDILKYVSDTETPQGVIALMKKPVESFEKLNTDIQKGDTFLLLDAISDAGNLGTIIRTCVTFGVHNIICNIGTVDAYNPKVIRSTMGALNKLNIYYLGEDEFISCMNDLKKNKYDVVATSLQADVYLPNYTPSLKTVYVIGNEANGVSNIVLENCSKHIKIPIEPIQESLNAGVATGIVLYDLYTRGEKTCHPS